MLNEPVAAEVVVLNSLTQLCIVHFLETCSHFDLDRTKGKYIYRKDILKSLKQKQIMKLSIYFNVR